MNGMKPTRKVGAGALGGAVAVVVVWGMEFGVDVPGQIAVAIGVICTFVTGWFVTD